MLAATDSVWNIVILLISLRIHLLRLARLLRLALLIRRRLLRLAHTSTIVAKCALDSWDGMANVLHVKFFDAMSSDQVTTFMTWLHTEPTSQSTLAEWWTALLRVAFLVCFQLDFTDKVLNCSQFI